VLKREREQRNLVGFESVGACFGLNLLPFVLCLFLSEVKLEACCRYIYRGVRNVLESLREQKRSVEDARGSEMERAPGKNRGNTRGFWRVLVS
jgi:hypothetical protein